MHVYVSSACHYGHHEQCRLVCKYCGAPCACDHHFIEGATVSNPETVDNPAAPDADIDEPTELDPDAPEGDDEDDSDPAEDEPVTPPAEDDGDPADSTEDPDEAPAEAEPDDAPTALS